jgi:hypothetical protein
MLALLLDLGRVERHRGFVHGEDPVQHRHGVAAEQRHEGPTGTHLSLFMSWLRSLGMHRADFFEW